MSSVSSMQIPLFPLSSVVLPGGLMPLRIFERRYIDMVRGCFREESGFGVCLVKEGGEVGDAAMPYPYGTLTRIIDWDQDESGLLLIVAQGQQKFRIVDTQVDDGNLLHGNVELLPLESSQPVPAEYRFLQEAMQQILEQVEGSIDYPEHQLEDALWLGSRFVELLPLSAELRHELLSLDQPLERLAALADMFTTIARHNTEGNSN